MPEVKKPPIAIIPQWQYIQCRLSELRTAVASHEQNGLQPPQDWIDEIEEILIKINKKRI
jgi:hypothetical protein